MHVFLCVCVHVNIVWLCACVYVSMSVWQWICVYVDFCMLSTASCLCVFVCVRVCVRAWCMTVFVSEREGVTVYRWPHHLPLLSHRRGMAHYVRLPSPVLTSASLSLPSLSISFSHWHFLNICCTVLSTLLTFWNQSCFLFFTRQCFPSPPHTNVVS